MYLHLHLKNRRPITIVLRFFQYFSLPSPSYGNFSSLKDKGLLLFDIVNQSLVCFVYKTQVKEIIWLKYKSSFFLKKFFLVLKCLLTLLVNFGKWLIFFFPPFSSFSSHLPLHLLLIFPLPISFSFYQNVLALFV